MPIGIWRSAHSHNAHYARYRGEKAGHTSPCHTQFVDTLGGPGQGRAADVPLRQDREFGESKAELQTDLVFGYYPGESRQEPAHAGTTGYGTRTHGREGSPGDALRVRFSGNTVKSRARGREN